MAEFSSHNKNDYSPRISTKIYALRRDGYRCSESLCLDID